MTANASALSLWIVGAMVLGGLAVPIAGVAGAWLIGDLLYAALIVFATLVVPIVAGWLVFVVGRFEVVVE